MSPAPQEDPRRLTGCLPLFRMAQAGTDLKARAAGLLDRAARNVDAADALMELSWIFSLTGEEAVAQSTQALALSLQQHFRLAPDRPQGQPGLRLLALMTPGEYLFNAPLECLLEDSGITLDLLFLGPHLPFPEALPAHDVLCTAIRQSDENLPLLRDLEVRLAHHPRPLINAPGRLPGLARDLLCARMSGVPGLLMPSTRRIARAQLEAHLRGQTFPCLVRAVGAHRGEDLVKLDGPSDLAPCLENLEATEFYVSDYIDYRGPDGLFRKVRLALIGGRPYACHLAISDHWMVNFINSHMELSAAKRAEEAAFMAHFDEGFALRHAAALGAIQARLQLDYVVLDCAEAPDGRFILFEADSAAIVHANDPIDLFPYKLPQMRRVFRAFQDLLIRASERDGPGL
ncbi:MAG TPA: hypothetical protein VJ549_09225 [Geothrix sp.]|nr:hypothetical protein [Geothrix sp.]